MADDQHSFGVRLRTLRETSGLSQEELAERAGLSSHAVSALERGTRTRPYPHTVRALADALGLEGEARSGLISSVPARGRTPRPAADRTGPGIPVPPTRLIGRDGDVRRVVELLDLHRLVTLTGPGGVGKTRLSLAVARTVQDRFADGVVYVELAAIHDPAAVVPAVLDAVGVTAASVDDPVGSLISWAADRELLLILDNAEQVIAAAPHVAELVARIPGLAMLVTSRAPLRLRAEREFPVEPLAVATGDGTESPAVRLLLERAAAVSEGWGTAPADEAAVAAICTRLAGIPLALELAAARCRLLGPAALLDRLDSVLQHGGSDRPERHRTMRATLDWSYSLLSAEEQSLLRLLSVFVGGFRLDDVEGVAQRARLDGDVLTLLEALAEQSLVTVEPAADGLRHRLLEPIAQYARSRLVEAGGEQRFARAHADHFLAVAEDVSPRYRDGGQVAALARVDAEHLNLTAGVETLLAAGDGQAAGRLCWALWMYWWLRGHHALGRRLSEAALELGQDGVVRGQAELAAATTCFAMDDVPTARAHWEAACDHAEGDRSVLANAIAGVGLADLAQGRLVDARARFAEAREAAAGVGGYGDWTTALSWIWSGTVSLLLGDHESAVREISEGLASARRRGDRLSTYIALYNLSQVELSRGRFQEAAEHLDEGTRLSRETSDHANLAYLLEARAVLEARQGAHARVPLLLGAAQAIREQLGSFGYGYYRPDPGAIADAAEEARARLGADRYDDALDVGRGLDPDRAAGLSLGELAHS
ncbi:ATP-binding protein [Nocardioides sp.]|uniref:ATP-binding protein n=1 Tax=Nocardioides sp. TaxID=35761 RepID=UPI002ED372C4